MLTYRTKCFAFLLTRTRLLASDDPPAEFEAFIAAVPPSITLSDPANDAASKDRLVPRLEDLQSSYGLSDKQRENIGHGLAMCQPINSKHIESIERSADRFRDLCKMRNAMHINPSKSSEFSSGDSVFT